jgi:hypothetical protein
MWGVGTQTGEYHLITIQQLPQLGALTVIMMVIVMIVVVMIVMVVPVVMMIVIPPASGSRHEHRQSNCRRDTCFQYLLPLHPVAPFDLRNRLAHVEFSIV